jgi:transposase
MSTTAPQPATTPIPVQLSEPEFEAFILPHLSMPKRGPKCKLGSYRVFHLILRVLYTGMQWKGLPIPHDTPGKPAIHDTTVSKALAKWADDGSLWQAFVASVRHLAAAKQLDIRILHGDGTNTVAKKGAMALASQGTNTKRARRSLRSSTIMARCELPSPWLPSMRPTWCCYRRASKR